MKKLLSLPLLLLMALLLLCACGEAEEPQNLVPFPIGGYQLVRPEEATADTIAHAVALYKELNAQGSDIRITTDFLNERKGETAPENELLFGLTERQESADANTEYAPDRFTYLIKIVGSKLVVLAGSDYAYGLAADFLLDAYDAEADAVLIPDGCYTGTWTPPLEGLCIDGTPINEFTVVVDNFPGWNLRAIAQKLCDAIDTSAGCVLPVVTDESEPTEHEIHITSAASIRDLPFENTDAAVRVHEGKLYLYANTGAEFPALLERVVAACFSEGSPLDVKDSAPTVSLFDYKEEIIAVKPGEGTLAAAFKTASDKMKAAAADSPVSVILELEGGTYSIDTMLGITGQNTVPFGKLTVRAAGKDSPVISGLTDLDPAGFTKVEGKDYYVYQFKTDEKGEYPVFRDFFDNGRAVPIATGTTYLTRTDFDDPVDRGSKENLKGIYVDKRAVEEIGEITAPTEFNIYVQWHAYTLHAIGVDWSDTKTVGEYELVRLQVDEDQIKEFVVGVNDTLSISGRPTFFTNHVSLLKPDSWAYDSENGRLYYYPKEGSPKAPAYSNLTILFKLVNTPAVTFEGITFTGTGCPRKAIDGYLSGQANTEKRYGTIQCAAILVEDCTNVTVKNCTFLSLGTNGIQAVNTLAGIEIRDCIFDDINMSAITLGNHAKTWDSKNALCSVVIENNTINNIGMEYPTAAAIYLSKVDHLKLNHNTISNTAYSGISVGWGWSTVTHDYGESINIRRAEIAYNRITDFMQLLNDGAAIYVLGGNVKIEHTEYFNFMHNNYAERTGSASSVKRGYYMDGASSNWEVYDSVCIGSSMPIFSQFHVKSQYTHNNYIHDIYTTHAVDTGNHAPSRTTILGDTFVVAAGKDALFAKYPKAKEIYEASGAR